jgi:hypothetical protein
MMSTNTIDTPMARQMVEAAAIRGASIIGQPGGWSVMLKVGMTEKPLGTQRTDKPRTWRTLDKCVEYLRTELHIVRVDGLDASNYSGAAVHTKRRADSAARLKAAHDAAAYDTYYREGVQASLDDPRPSIPHEEVMARSKAIIDAAARKKALAHG